MQPLKTALTFGDTKRAYIPKTLCHKETDEVVARKSQKANPRCLSQPLHQHLLLHRTSKQQSRTWSPAPQLPQEEQARSWSTWNPPHPQPKPLFINTTHNLKSPQLPTPPTCWDPQVQAPTPLPPSQIPSTTKNPAGLPSPTPTLTNTSIPNLRSASGSAVVTDKSGPRVTTVALLVLGRGLHRVLRVEEG